MAQAGKGIPRLKTPTWQYLPSHGQDRVTYYVSGRQPRGGEQCTTSWLQGGKWLNWKTEARSPTDHPLALKVIELSHVLLKQEHWVSPWPCCVPELIRSNRKISLIPPERHFMQEANLWRGRVKPAALIHQNWARLIATSLEYPGENLALVICSILLHLNIVHIFLPALVCYLQNRRLSRIH